VGNYLSFEETPVWKKAHALILDIYKFTSKFPKEEQFALTSQLRRAAVSIEANIAESFGRFHFPDRLNFFYHARGSLEETKSHLLLSKDLGYLNQEDFGRLRSSAEQIGMDLNRVIATTRSKKDEQ